MVNFQKLIRPVIFSFKLFIYHSVSLDNVLAMQRRRKGSEKLWPEVLVTHLDMVCHDQHRPLIINPFSKLFRT